MKSSTKKAIAVGGGLLGLLLIGGAAAASDDEVLPDDGPDDDEEDIEDILDPTPEGPKRSTDRPEDPPPPPNPLLNDYVGSNYDWPYRDFFPDEESFGTVLAIFGYNVGNIQAADWTVLRGFVMKAVREFQRDYNKVRLLVPESSRPKKLALQDGLIGKNTIPAMIWAFGRVRDTDVPWQDMVAAAEA